jgi:hypothetical protein
MKSYLQIPVRDKLLPFFVGLATTAMVLAFFFFVMFVFDHLGY